MVNPSMAGAKLETFEFPVERGKIKEFARAICNPDPVYIDWRCARSLGLPDAPMPVTFPVTFAFHLLSENSILEGMLKLGMDPAKSVHGETDITHYRNVYAGETLHGEMVVGEIYQKEGHRGGTMTFVEMDINFYDDEDRLVVNSRNIFIERG